MSDTKDKNCKRSQDRCEVAYDFNHLKFSSNEIDTFRASITTVADGVTLWLESKKSKTQWQETFKSIAECGPAGVPEDAVVAFLKRAFEGLQAENADLKAGNDEPELDLKMIGGEAVLTLTMSVGGIWKPKFVFSLLPVGLDKLDILEAKLRDAQEEIQHLRAGSTVTYFSVCSAAACQPNQTVVWNGTSPREICSSQFVLSEDGKTVTILKEGVYHLNVRLSGPCHNNSTYFNVHCNGNMLFDSFSNNANGYHMSACITQVLRLKKNDILHVVWMSNHASHSATTSNNFSLLLLGK